MPSAATILKVTFVLMLIAAVIMAITAFVTKHYGLLGMLPFAIFGTITAFIYGSSGKPKVTLDPPGTGGTITLDYPWWVWLVDVLLLIGGVICVKLAW